MNSLGFPGCDLDIYLDLGPEVEGSEHHYGLKISNPKMAKVVESTVKEENGEEGGEKAKIRAIGGNELKQEIKEERVILDEAAELVKVQPELERPDPISQQQKVRTAAKILRGVPECSRVHPILQVKPFSSFSLSSVSKFS